LISEAQGFPSKLLRRDARLGNLIDPLVDPLSTRHFENELFRFQNKEGARIFHLDPVRVYLVENIDGKWLFWGKAFVVSQTIEKKFGPGGEWKPGDWITSGTFKIVEIFDPEYQEEFTKRESPPGKSVFL
jgi:hypothetical protein